MASIFEVALGQDFQRLHPMLQKRFGVDTEAGYGCVGHGVFSEVRRGAWWTVPFLRLGAYRNILFPDQGNDIPFTIENYPYIDGFGRPTVTFVRTLDLPSSKRRRFDATMVHSERSGGIVDYLGTHQHLATDLELEVLADGSLHLQSGAQRFYEGFAGFTFPAVCTGTADLYEGFDDIRGVFTIQMQVRNPVVGFLFGYRGEFTCTYPSLSGTAIPAHLKPLREESRE
ncbi:DUF4166 domain-containing protein [Pseudarthrobacter sp. NIBRBAC000502772]|uniref:DUF4166 domain-containing protein n=1 Tax=Pseudarthrobacter sp. NIBRBAC000502772 TaxID=2590775 RepID=UPI0011322939|nr:DUF4166 domain-containing protein [Pseudarthrobacter sp. NIBRBAC000502772]QDG64852.1 DUF4166 domain-containing protein [Pseudarthrobacter sp. NIBRBAC000502772]